MTKSTSTQMTISLPTEDEVIFIPPSKTCYPFADEEESMLRLGAMQIYSKAMRKVEGVHMVALCRKQEGVSRSFFERWVGLFGQTKMRHFDEWVLDEFKLFVNCYTSAALEAMPFHFPNEEKLISSLTYL